MGKDENDETSRDIDPAMFTDLSAFTQQECSSLRCAIPKEFLEAHGLDNEVKALFEDYIENCIL